MWGTYGNTSQDNIQLGFFIAAIVSIPLMLLPKPLYEIYCNKKHHQPEKQEKLMSEDNMAEDLARRSSAIDSEISRSVASAEE